jgi:hypothetical protein
MDIHMRQVNFATDFAEIQSGKFSLKFQALPIITHVGS